MLFAVATLFILLVLLHYSTVISKLTDQNVVLAQRLALLERAGQPGRRTTGGLKTNDVAGVGVVDPVRAHADPVSRPRRARSVDERRVAGGGRPAFP